MLVYKFSPSKWLENMKDNPENQCYCMEGKEKFCDKNGIRDISNCMKAPVVMSQPHFLEADEEFHLYARGTQPDPEAHSSVLYIEPQTGTPVKAAKRAQINMDLRRISGFSLVQNVSEGLFPLVWLEETVLVDEVSLLPVSFPLLIQWLANVTCFLLVAVLVKVTICSLIAFLYLSRLCCFRSMTSNRITALFYRPKDTTAETSQ